ncbi:uncharacterized protein LOC129793907 [Lutzomyia longipalpis]|uniref:uncharacterized protein LOC129793907 n=1 Tax=Lutzomyia longipalpis TaxID=7200 RepID=UPI002483D4B2|nr:uncharacterized protein LOC129793907 [Lutzomyia longipalpis]
MRVLGTFVALVALSMPPLNGHFGKKCSINTQKLLSLLNLLCNSTQVTVTTRDACYGCFFRAGSLNPGDTQVALLSQCATMYLVNTSYAPCIATLMQPSAVSSLSHCYTGHCAFVQCIRRFNSALLVDECMTQALATNPNFQTTQAGRIALLGNATGCILARARCSQFNPITGVYQGTTLSATTLQIAPNGDLRVVAFPPNLPTVELFCSSRNTLDQAVYQGAIC